MPTENKSKGNTCDQTKELEKKRVLNDITEFAKKIKKAKKNFATQMAINYANDAQYFLDNGDIFTAWGCINYAFGLIDANLEYGKKPKKQKH